MTAEQGRPAGMEPAGLPVEPAPPDEDPTKPESPVPPARVEQVVVPRWLQAMALAAVLLGLSALGQASRPASRASRASRKRDDKNAAQGKGK